MFDRSDDPGGGRLAAGHDHAHRSGLDALEMGLWTRRRDGKDVSQLVHLSDYAEENVKPRVGLVGASFLG